MILNIRLLNNKKIVLVILAVMMSGMFIPSMAIATSMEIKPNIFKSILKPGQTTEIVAEVINHSNNKIIINIEREIWSPKNKIIDIESCLKFQQDRNIELNKNEPWKLFMEATLPATIKSEIVIMVFLTEEQAKDKFSIKTRVGFPIYLKNSHNKNKQAKITKFESYQKKEDVIFNFTVVNQGQTHILPFGVVMIKHDNKILKQKEVVYQKPIFPSESMDHIVKIEGSKLKLATYEAQLKLFLNDIYDQKLSAMSMPMIKKNCYLRVGKL